MLFIYIFKIIKGFDLSPLVTVALVPFNNPLPTFFFTSQWEVQRYICLLREEVIIPFEKEGVVIMVNVRLTSWVYHLNWELQA